MLVPTKPDDPSSEPNREAWEKLKHWEKPFLTAFSDSDPITTGGDRLFQKLIPGCKGMPHKTIVGAGHLGNYHAQQLNNIPGVELIGVFDLLKEKAALFSKIQQFF